MRSIRLVATDDEYDTALGFVIKGMPKFEGRFADRDGIGVAHDVLEHQNGLANMGPVWDELEALGGIWQVRGRHGYLMTGGYNDHRVHWNIASDISRMFVDWTCEHSPSVPRTRRHDRDDDFMECIEIARAEIPKEWSFEFAGDEKRRYQEDLSHYLDETLHRMRIGYRKAERRFGTDSKGESTFIAIREAVEGAVKQIEFEGQEFILRYGRGRAICHQIDPYS
jgi:hypothetical protein